MVNEQKNDHRKVNFRTFTADNEGIKDVDVVFPMSAVRTVNEMFTTRFMAISWVKGLFFLLFKIM